MFDDFTTNSAAVDDCKECVQCVHVDSDSADSVSISLWQADELKRFDFISERRMNCLSDDVNGKRTSKHFATRGPF